MVVATLSLSVTEHKKSISIRFPIWDSIFEKIALINFIFTKYGARQFPGSPELQHHCAHI
jgi:hypothetical protein